MSLGGAIANQAAALAPAQGRVERAEAAMAVYDARQAAQHARAASEIAEQISAAAGRFDSIQTGIGAEREASQAVVAQGYRLDRSEEALVASEAALASAADALQSDGPAATTPRLDTAQAKLDEGVASGSGAPALRERNERRLAETEARGKEASALITRGREAFDSVDEFAESTWSDIRGNGSEAQAAAGRAQRHWEVARQGNTMEEQAFFAASEQLDAAAQELDFVDKLIDAILTRLKDLEAARDAAKGLLDEAERSLNAALEFVRGNDADVGQVPEVQLHDAAAQLKAAQAEAGQAKPDWLKLAAAATQADQLADAALAGARGEAETMAKLRQQAAQLRTLVSTEVSKIAKFVNVRGADITPTSLVAVKALVQGYEQAEALERRAAEVAEDERRKALQGAVAALTGLQVESGKVFGAVQADAKRLEELRGELTSALAGADSALDEAEALLLQAGGRAPGNARGRLSQARASFDTIRLPISGEAALRQKTDQARGIANEARAVANDIRGRLTTHRPGGIGPVIITGGWGGNGSWGGGKGGGGGGGPHWGSFGGGGGSFGGGGGGGSFGGGGGGGGGW